MNEVKNNSQTSTGAEYAGPPKSHDFQNNTSMLTPKETHPEAMEKPVSPKKEQAPHQTTSGLNAPAEEDNELLRIISAPDRRKEEEEKAKKKLLKFNFNITKSILKLRRRWNEFKEKNKKILHILNYGWITVKAFTYLLGFSFFTLCFLAYFSFEPIVRSYLDKHDLKNISFERANHSLSEFTLHNVKDKNGLFTIKKIKVQYTFADLLEKKIPSVEFDTLKLHIQENVGSTNTTQSFLQTLLNLGVFERSLAFSIESLRFENSVLYVGNKEYEIPINFNNGLGSLNRKKHFIFPITLQNEIVDLKANVDVDIAQGTTTWTMDIVNGSITPPGLRKELLKGKATLKTRNGKLSSLNFNGSLTRDRVKKNLEIKVQPTTKKRISIDTTLTIPEKGGSVVYLLNLADVSIDRDFKSFETNAPLFFKASNLSKGDLKIDAVQLSAEGTLKCDGNGCTYQTQKSSELILFAPNYNFYDTKFSVTYPLRLMVEASKENSFEFNSEKFAFNMIFEKTAFDVQKKNLSNAEEDTLKVNLTSARINGMFDIKESKLSFNTAGDFSQIKDSSFHLDKGKFQLDYADNGFNAKITAQEAQLEKIDYFKAKVNLNAFFNSDYYFAAQMKSDNKQLDLDVNGYYHPYTSEVLMAIQTNKPIVFKKDLPTPYELSSLFSDKIQNANGKISLKGQIHYKDVRSISGPLSILLDNLSFDYGNTSVKKANAVLNVTQLVPFGALGAQDIFAEALTTVLPFTNVNAQVFFDADRKQFNISSLSANLADYQMFIDPAWYNYGASSFNFTLKGKTEPVQDIVKATTLKSLVVKGNGTISTALQMEDANVTIKSFELLVPNEGSIAYTPKVYANPYFETLKQLDFRNMSIQLAEKGNNLDFIFASDNKSNKIKKRTNFRFTIKEPLSKYVKPKDIAIPYFIQEAKENF